MACACSICEVFQSTSDKPKLSTASNRQKLEEGRQRLHSAYTGKAQITDEQEVQLFTTMIRLANADGLGDLSKMLQHLLDS
ncbi:hypothetical protein PV04_10951 [Phialophora macrospora]|uniref:Uncharacterized protein n=1 Tax=Phialophora macrospora TaxID=1851006 RepID=A0A0D2CCM4_9EURO|nr:hypothetical protein PV04_10951 [Phialophora macrospora]